MGVGPEEIIIGIVFNHQELYTGVSHQYPVITSPKFIELMEESDEVISVEKIDDNTLMIYHSMENEDFEEFAKRCMQIKLTDFDL